MQQIPNEYTLLCGMTLFKQSNLIMDIIVSNINMLIVR